MSIKKISRNNPRARWLTRLETIRPFREVEAWAGFRLAAFGEAVGWTLLITAIVLRDNALPGGAYSVPIGGRIHGTLFVVYFGVLIATYTSLRWPRWKFLVAAAAGVVPYGTLVFEMWAAHMRRSNHRKGLLASTVLAAVSP